MDEEKKPCPLCGIVDSVSDFMRRPFNPGGTALQWTLFVGLLLTIVWCWNVILLQLNEELS